MTRELAFEEWCRVVDVTLMQRGRGATLDDFHEASVRGAYESGLPPITFALADPMPLKPGRVPNRPSPYSGMQLQTVMLPKGGAQNPLAIIMLVFGFLLMVIALLFYNVSADGQVVNLGRMSEREMLMLIGVALFLGGAIFRTRAG